MAAIKPPDLVKPVFGILYRDHTIFETAVERIETEFGPVDFLSEEFPFVETDYYESEMGTELSRRYLSLHQLINPEELVRYKRFSNAIEEELSCGGRRRINLDPGLISSSNLVLASAKNFSHRIHLGEGIYAEVTMIFMKGEFTKLPWTYPDYLHHKDVFHEIRLIYKKQLHASSPEAT